ncbi:hypothetical protein EMCRGX_G009334 [Ephydatia muelleri]
MSARKNAFVFQPKIQPPLLPTHRQDRCASHAAVLPNEVLLHLFKRLTDPKDRASCRHVCRAWYEVMNDHTLWVGRTVCLKRLLSVPRYCWDLLKRRRPSRIQVRLSAKTPRQLQLAFEQLRRLIVEDIPHVTSLHLLVSSNIDLTGLSVAMTMFRRLQTLAFTNLSSHSKALIGLETALDHAVSLTELEIAGFRIPDLSSASHPDLVVLKLSLREAISPSQLSALLKQLPHLKHLELSTANASVDGKSIRKRIRSTHPWFLADDEDGAGDEQGAAKPSHVKSLEALARLVAGQHSLTHLDLSGTQCSDEVLQALATTSCPLRSLELGMCAHVTMEGLRYLSNMASSDLTHLGLSHCARVEQEGVALLPTMFPSLASLDLSGWSLSSKTLSKLYQRTQLRTLVLRGVNPSILQDSLHTRRCSIIT